jgi:hypothetical protein
VWIATYMAATCAVALACVIRLKETVARDLEEPGPSPLAVVVST